MNDDDVRTALQAEGLVKLARMLVHDALKTLTKEPPPRVCPPGRRRPDAWAKAWRDWWEHRNYDLRWLQSPKASAAWMEMAGFEWDAVISDLRDRGLLDPVPKSFVPEDAWI